MKSAIAAVMLVALGILIGTQLNFKRQTGLAPSIESTNPAKIHTVEKLSAGVQLSYFTNLLGEATFKNVQENDLIEWIFVDPDYYIQAITDKEDKVLAYAITTRSESFTPNFNIAGQRITLRATTFGQLRQKGEPIECSWNLGNTAPSWYWEAYSYGNPGLYQDYIYAINNSASYSNWPSPSENSGSMFEGDICRKMDEDDLNSSPINTIMVIGVGVDRSLITKSAFYIGPDPIQLRTLLD